jgi:chloride channel 3/4/5
MDSKVEAINVGHCNTVRTLRDQLARLVATGYADTGFPILRADEDDKLQLLGYIGGNELEHALSTSLSTWPRSSRRRFINMLIRYGIFLFL